MKNLSIIVLSVLAILACSVLSMLVCDWIAPTATPDPDDAIVAPMSDWMDLEILRQYPSAGIWPPIGVTKDTLIYRGFVYGGVRYVAIFGWEDGRWEIVDVIEVIEEVAPTTTPSPSYKQDT